MSVVARVPEKSTVTGNRYMQKFLQLSPWQPRDLKVIAGKVDYPSWPWLDRFMIRLIMKMTHGPTDTSAVIDYTNWDDVRAYGEHLLTLRLERQLTQENRTMQVHGSTQPARRPAVGGQGNSASTRRR